MPSVSSVTFKPTLLAPQPLPSSSALLPHPPTAPATPQGPLLAPTLTLPSACSKLPHIFPPPLEQHPNPGAQNSSSLGSAFWLFLWADPPPPPCPSASPDYEHCPQAARCFSPPGLCPRASLPWQTPTHPFEPRGWAGGPSPGSFPKCCPLLAAGHATFSFKVPKGGPCLSRHPSPCLDCGFCRPHVFTPRINERMAERVNE